MKKLQSFQWLPCGLVGRPMMVFLEAMVVAGLAYGSMMGAEQTASETFKLQETSVFDLSGGAQQEAYFLRGQTAACEEKAAKEVKAYPAFASKKPIYGSVRLGGGRNEKDTGKLFCFAIDESNGTGKGYDRFVFDLDRDGDLKNDKVLTAQQNPPKAALQTYSSIKQQMVFEPLLVEFDFGAAGLQKVQLVPRLTISVYDKEEYKSVSLIRTRVFTGDIKLAGQTYRAVLGNDHFISGRLDLPDCALMLSPKENPNRRPRWWGGDRLKAVHKVGGRFFSFSASPTGDQLVVHPYAGDVGAFEMGAGGRMLAKMTVNGSLYAKDKAVAVGEDSPEEGWPKAARSCQLPVGDYLPNYLTIEYGRLRINVSQNYHSEGKPRDRQDRPPVYGLHVTKEKPCLLDFSNKPDVMFASPASGHSIKRGETLLVSAVLVDPVLDIMIRGLDDTTRKEKKDAHGNPITYERNVSLDPKVIITRANGKKVAEGVMPFG